MKNKLATFLAFLGAMIGFLLLFGKAEWFPDFYNQNFMAGSAFVGVFLIVLPKLIFRVPVGIEGAEKKNEAVNNLQRSTAIVLTLNAIGSLSGWGMLFNLNIELDKIVHFLVALIAVFAISSFASGWYRADFRHSLLVAMTLVFFAGFLWELFEYSIDLIFNTKTFGIYGEQVVRDTTMDLIMDIVGIAVGTFILVLKITKNKTWESIKTILKFSAGFLIVIAISFAILLIANAFK